MKYLMEFYSLGRSCIIGITAKCLVVGGVDFAGAARKLPGILLRIASEAGAQARDVQTQIARSTTPPTAEGGHT